MKLTMLQRLFLLTMMVSKSLLAVVERPLL